MQRGIFLRPTIDIENLGLDAGAHLLVKQALLALAPGAELLVTGCSPGWDAQLLAWCRSQGHACAADQQQGRTVVRIVRGSSQTGRPE